MGHTDKADRRLSVILAIEDLEDYSEAMQIVLRTKATINKLNTWVYSEKMALTTCRNRFDGGQGQSARKWIEAAMNCGLGKRSCQFRKAGTSKDEERRTNSTKNWKVKLKGPSDRMLIAIKGGG